MTQEKILPERLQRGLVDHLDEFMKQARFTRKENSLIYNRKVEYGKQSFHLSLTDDFGSQIFSPGIDVTSTKINRLLKTILATSNNNNTDSRYSQVLEDMLSRDGWFISVSLWDWKTTSEPLRKRIAALPHSCSMESQEEVSQRILCIRNIMEHGLLDELNTIQHYSDISSDQFITGKFDQLHKMLESFQQNGKRKNLSDSQISDSEKPLFFSFGAMVILKEYQRALQFLNDFRTLDDPRYYDFRSVAREYIQNLPER